MRFVTPETVRYNLADGDWIEVKQDLNVAEDRQYKTSAFRKLSTGDSEVDVRWEELALARVIAYLVDWSATYENKKPRPCTPAEIKKLAVEAFEEIDTVIQTHIERRTEEKKLRNGKETPTEPTS